MIIIWGKKVKRVQAGVAGEYCPFCRNITKQSVTEVRSVSHLYYVPLGSGTPQFYELRCHGCHSATSATLQACRPVDDREGVDVIELADATHAGGAQDLLERMERDAKSREATASTTDRMQLMFEPFMHIEYTLQTEMRKGSQASATAVITLLTIVGVIASLFMWMAIFDPAFRPSVSYFVITALVTLATIGLSIWTVMRIVRTPRYALQACGATPTLVMSLRPFNPSLDELRELFRVLRSRRGVSIGKAITPEELHELLNRPA